MADLRLADITIEQEESDYIRVGAGPFESGLGTTIGNAMRRILLSSLPGAAISVSYTHLTLPTICSV